MPPRKSWNYGRKLTTAETMLAAIGPSPALLVRRGLSPARVARLEREWTRWDDEYGFAWRVGAGIPTPADRSRIDGGERPDVAEPPDPPGL